MKKIVLSIVLILLIYGCFYSLLENDLKEQGSLYEQEVEHCLSDKQVGLKSSLCTIGFHFPSDPWVWQYDFLTPGELFYYFDLNDSMSVFVHGKDEHGFDVVYKYQLIFSDSLIKYTVSYPNGLVDLDSICNKVGDTAVLGKSPADLKRYEDGKSFDCNEELWIDQKSYFKNSRLSKRNTKKDIVIGSIIVSYDQNYIYDENGLVSEIKCSYLERSAFWDYLRFDFRIKPRSFSTQSLFYYDKESLRKYVLKLDDVELWSMENDTDGLHICYSAKITRLTKNPILMKY